MPVQTWSVNTQPAVAGEMYGLATTNSQRLTYSAEAKMERYGLPVKQGSKANLCAIGQEADGSILGITMRSDKLESATRPGDGTVLIPALQPLAVMLSGPINILATAAITGKDVGVNPATGEFGAPGGSYVKVPNLTMIEYPLAAGSVGAVMVNVFTKVAAPVEP